RSTVPVTLSSFHYSYYSVHLALLSLPTRRSSDLSRAVPHKRTFIINRLGKQFTTFSRGKLTKIPYGRSPRYIRLQAVGSKVSQPDRKRTRLNSSHVSISYDVFCL